MQLCAEEERSLRRIMCFFLAIEALIVCAVFLISSDNDLVMLKYHEENLSDFMIPIIPCAVMMIAVTGSYFSKVIYFIYELLHFVIGIVIAALSIFSFNIAVFMFAITIALVFCSRFWHYIRVKPKWKMPEETSGEDEYK